MSRAAARIAAGFLAGSLAAGCAPAAELTAPEIVARNVAARGGLEAWRKVQTMVWVGRIESARAPVPDMEFALEQKRPNKTRLEIHAMGQGSVRLFDGLHGWKVRPAAGRPEVQPYTPAELKFAQAGSGLDGPLVDYAAKGSSVTLKSLDDLEGKKAYHLQVHRAQAGDEDVWVDAQTFLDVRYDRMADAPSGGQRRVSLSYGDWRTVDGLKVPFLIETGSGQTADKMRIESVVLNAPLDDATFDNPTKAGRQERMRPPVVSRATAPAPPPAAPTAVSGDGGAAPR